MTDSDREPRLVEVAVDAPVKGPLPYFLPPSLLGRDLLGCRVLAPLQGRRVTGYVVGFPQTLPLEKEKIRTVIEVLDPEPLLDPGLLPLLRWAARYYFAPLAEAIKTALPPGINLKSRTMILITEQGRQALEPADGGQSPLAPAELELLGRLSEQGPLGKAGLPGSRVKKLLERGLVEQAAELPGPRVREKTERALRLTREPSPSELERLARAPAQRRLLAELKGGEPVKLGELRARFADPMRPARALEKLGLVEIVALAAPRDPFFLELQLPPPPLELMPEQEAALKEINRAAADGRFQVFLLRGVTGSGKTEVYLRAIERALAAGKGAILLAPEISLTPQLTARLRQRFPAEALAVLHSGLSPGERHDQWRRLREGRARIAVGARSAVFAPVRDLGLIVVDEEQDPAYKQDHGFMYQARDLAVMRGREQSAVVILGSATPSLESAARAEQDNGYRLLTLPRRAVDRPLPGIELIDLRKEPRPDPAEREFPADDERIKDQDRLAADQLLSPRLREELAAALSRGEQSLLFINRRGLSTFLFCFDCGGRPACPNCAVSLVYHRGPTRQKRDEFYGEAVAGGYLLCHYCGYHEPLPEVCPNCRGVRFFPFGAGAEQVERAVAALHPSARIQRVDSDVMGSRESYFRLLDAAGRGEVDILVGTQLLAKGHDLPGVTLVGVLLADLSLNLPDFRAAEQTFQLLTQVAGRAGRGDRPGKVLVQTFNPEHYAVQFALGHDYPGFQKEEMRRRQALGYPPAARLAACWLRSLSPEAVKNAAREFARVARAKARTRAFTDRVRVLGPAPAPIARLRGKTRWLTLVKAETPALMSGFLESVLAGLSKKKIPGGVDLIIDRDPAGMM